MRATLRPIEEFPLAHPAATDPATKSCLGLGASSLPELHPIPASGRTYDAATGACTAERTGGELLYNLDAVGSVSGLGAARRSRVVVARDTAGDAYLLIVNGAVGAPAGGRVGVALSGRALADGASRPNALATPRGSSTRAARR